MVRFVKGRTKHTLVGALILVCLAVLSNGWSDSARLRMIREEEETLMNVEFDALDFKDLTFDQALQMTAEKVHERGHPELQLELYSDPHKLDGFHVQVDPSNPDTGKTHSVSLMSGLKLRSLLWYLSFAYGGTCVLQGNKLVGVPANGTFQPFERATWKLHPPRAALFAEQGLHAFAKENGVIFYEGMVLEYRRERSEVIVYAPPEQMTLLSIILDPLPSRWQRLKWQAEAWYARFFRR